jgi:hypothetical protein
MDAVFEGLWGGIMTSVSFDATQWVLRAEVQVQMSDRIESHVLTLDGITELTFKREVSLPWTYAELTEMYAEGDSGDLTVECVLWNEPTGLVARCAGVTVEPPPGPLRISRT